MKRTKDFFLPDRNGRVNTESQEPLIVKNGSPCPCCGYRTIPNNGDAIAYICPICYWEIDVFLSGEEEPSDENHGLSLKAARNNYKTYGAVLPRLKRYCRLPTKEEQEDFENHFEEGKNAT